MGKIKIAILEGTTRQRRQSIKVARLIERVGQEIKEIEVQLVDPRDLNLPGDGNDPEGKDSRYSQITAKADAFFIIVPEYNHSFPGSLKRMLDSELENYIHKPAVFAGVSSGRFSGVRAIESLVPVTRELGLVASFADVHVANVQDAFNEGGSPKDKELIDRIKNSYQELIWLAKTLKWGRENLSSKYHE